MIDRQAIIAEVRNWVEEITGLGFRRADTQFWEEGAMPEPLRQLTARGVATRSRKKPDVRIKSLSGPSQRCERILRQVEAYDHRYRSALILYSCAPTVSMAVDSMRRSAVDFGRFSEAGLALYAAYGRQLIDNRRPRQRLTTAVGTP